MCIVEELGPNRSAVTEGNACVHSFDSVVCSIGVCCRIFENACNRESIVESVISHDVIRRLDSNALRSSNGLYSIVSHEAV